MARGLEKQRQLKERLALAGQHEQRLHSLHTAPKPAECTLSSDREQVTEIEAPSNSLPSWSECNLRVGNSEWLKDNDREAECDSLTANPLHKFIYEYDDSDAYKSAWFLHRLENLIGFIRSEQHPCNECREINDDEAQGLHAKQSPWIPVSERLPKPGVSVLVYSPGDALYFDHIDEDCDDGDRWYGHDQSYEHYCNVAKPSGSVGPDCEAPYTHWMAIPEPPEEGSE